MDTAYLGLRTLRLTAAEGPEPVARILREHWGAAAPLRRRPYWLARVTWLQLAPLPGTVTSARAVAGS